MRYSRDGVYTLSTSLAYLFHFNTSKIRRINQPHNFLTKL